MSGGKRVTIEIIRSELAKRNYKLTSTVFIKRSEHLSYICLLHDELCSSSWDSLRQGKTSCKPCAKEKSIATTMALYGVENVSQNEEIKKQKMKTLIMHYNVQNPMQSEEIKKKSVDTSRKRYGVDYPAQSEEVKKKMRNTCMEKYGHEYAMQSEEIKEKISEWWCNITPERLDERNKKLNATSLEKYGTEWPSQNEEVRAKTIATNLERWGVECPFQNEEVKVKKKKTVMKKYGVEFVAQSEDVKKKMADTNLKRYGNRNFLQSKLWRQKVMDRYGVENYTQTEEFKEKSKATNFYLHGVSHYTQTRDFKEKSRKTTLARYGVDSYSKTTECKERVKSTNLERYGVKHPTQNAEIRRKQVQSSFRTKSYSTPSGLNILCQGYEPFVYDRLISQRASEKELFIGFKISPTVKYSYLGKNHVYFPDIYLPSISYLVEVKSTWTLKKDIEKTAAKMDASRRGGFTIELWVVDKQTIINNYFLEESTTDLERKLKIDVIKTATLMRKWMFRYFHFSCDIVVDYLGISDRELVSQMGSTYVKFVCK